MSQVKNALVTSQLNERGNDSSEIFNAPAAFSLTSTILSILAGQMRFNCAPVLWRKYGEKWTDPAIAAWVRDDRAGPA
jgi:hypothetical protein